MKRKFLILILLLLLTGCSTNYNLKVSNNSFKENIDLVIEKNIEVEATDEIIEKDDQVTPFLNEKTASLTTNDKFYKKKVKDLDNYAQVQMSYKYTEDEFKNANSINLCFEYPELDFNENYYIHLQGEFYCLYGDSIDIKIETKNKVYSNNADKVDGNTYIWHINSENIDYVDIEIDIDKGVSTYDIIFVVISVIALISLLFIGIKLYKNNKEKNKF